MKIPAILSSLFILLVLGYVQGEEKDCKAAVSELTKKQLKAVTECTADMKFKNAKEKQQKKTCVMKCVLTRLGVLTPDGYNDPIGSLVFVTASLPSSAQDWARTVIMGCFEGTANLIPSEEDCKSYDPLVKCSLQALNLFCQPK